MALLRSIRGLSLSFCVVGLAACSLLEGESSDDNGGNDDCTEGETKSCKGAQGCQGMSLCDADGKMGKCVCGGGGTGGGGSGCTALQACCNSSAFPETARASCLSVVDFGDGTTCTAAVDQYRAAGLCGSAGAGGTNSGGTSGGGVSGTGGISGASGTTGLGGSSAGTAGAGGISGASGTGGGVAGSTSGTGGSGGEPTCGASFATLGGGFVTAPGTSGCWHGYAYIAISSGSTSTPTDYMACTDPCTLCASGSVAATTDYSGYAMIGVNLNQGSDGATTATVSPAGTSLVVNFTNSSASPLRVQILGANGDTVATERWCAELPTVAAGPVTIPYTSFNTECWAGGAGVAYARQPIKAVQLLVPGGNTTSIPYSMCLTSVSDN